MVSAWSVEMPLHFSNSDALYDCQVLYQMFRKFTLIGMENLVLLDFVAGACSFFVIAFGGTFIGVAFAFVVSILTRSIKYPK